MIKVAVLTSSRADYGIYLPLLKEFIRDNTFDLTIIAFGAHLSSYHGNTINQIIEDGFRVNYQISTLVVGDSPEAISTSMSLTGMKFAQFWDYYHTDFDIVFCLGDRYEMYAAVYAAVPFNIKFAHIHGGETTLGAIDNVFRGAITLASKYHFVSCEQHLIRVSEIKGSLENIYNIGALGLDNLTDLKFMSKAEFFSEFHINLDRPLILVTLHPETEIPGENKRNAEILANCLLELKRYNIIISLPNADTENLVIRDRFLRLPKESENRIICVENMGTRGYFTAMNYASFLIGNSSSGIIEAASFNKRVLNLGIRQKGRIQSNNVDNIPFDSDLIFKAVQKIEEDTRFDGPNVYFKGNAAKTIINIIKNLYERF